MYIIELENGVYKANLVGDPGRTLVKSNAQLFKNTHSAKISLGLARKYKPFINAKIIPINI
jgi:hypothetical protein